MPLDTSTYSLALLRLDGRRWNELRRLTAQISTQAAADGSSYLEMGNTKVICTVTGPAEAKAGAALRPSGDEAAVAVEISIAGFSGVDRKRRGRNDKYVILCHVTYSNSNMKSQTSLRDANHNRLRLCTNNLHKTLPPLCNHTLNPCPFPRRITARRLSKRIYTRPDRRRRTNEGLHMRLYSR